jgi:DNA-binding MarR family transcriptional regulator
VIAPEPATGSQRGPAQRPGFLLAQIGAFATMRFAQRLEDLGLTPSDVGLLRLIALNPGQSQQTLAQSLGVVPSRVVALIDELQNKDLVHRERSTTDRRNYELHLTSTGQAAMNQMREIATAHEKDILSGLSVAERKSLTVLLGKIASSHNLTPDVHPDYRDGRRPDRTTGST